MYAVSNALLNPTRVKDGFIQNGGCNAQRRLACLSPVYPAPFVAWIPDCTTFHGLHHTAKPPSVHAGTARSVATHMDASRLGDTSPLLTCAGRIREPLRMLLMFTVLTTEMTIVSMKTFVTVVMDNGQHHC